MSQISMKQLASFVRKMHLSSGSVIVVRRESPLAEGDNIRRLGEVIENTSLRDVILLVTDNLSDVEIKTRQQMNSLGWYHIDQIRKAATINTMRKIDKEKERVQVVNEQETEDIKSQSPA